jgi:hypothetical protein
VHSVSLIGFEPLRKGPAEREVKKKYFVKHAPAIEKGGEREVKGGLL